MNVEGAGCAVEQADAVEHHGRGNRPVEEILEAGLVAAPVVAQETGQHVAGNRQELDGEVDEDQVIGAGCNAHRQAHHEEEGPEFALVAGAAVHVAAAGDGGQDHSGKDGDLDEAAEVVDGHHRECDLRHRFRGGLGDFGDVQLQHDGNQGRAQEEGGQRHVAEAGLLADAGVVCQVQTEDEQAADQKYDFGCD